MQNLEFHIFKCSQCNNPESYWTLGELENHRLAHHELAMPGQASHDRITLESTIIGRARTSEWVPDMTHWHAERIAGRA